MEMFLEKQFKLKENGTNVKTEVVAGVTTFMTMAYILVVNPEILEAAGMDRGAVFTATALASAIACIAMALLANYPVALASGMGLNAYFAYVVCGSMGYSWKIALTAIFIEGIIFIILTLTRFRESMINSIPSNLKYGITVGIGLFITFIGFQNAQIIVNDDATLVALGNLKSITVILSILGVLIIGVLLHKKVKGAILLGILATYVLGIICQLVGLYKVGVDGYNLIPNGIISLPPSLSPIFFKLDFKGAFNMGVNFLVVMFAFLFVDLFDTVGTLIGVASQANMLTKDGKLPRARQALLADAIGTVEGACLGTSTITSFVESSAGVAVGGRTGLTAIVTGLLMIASLIFSPILTIIPSFATAPALIIVGLLMVSSIKNIDFTSDYTDAIPAFLAMVIMPMAYSIADGIMVGILSWFILKIISGKIKEIHPVIYVLVILFVLKIIA